MSKAYDPAAVQTEVAAVWEAENCFHADPAAKGEPYSVVIPPPNVTAALHFGHALNNTVQDVLIRKCAAWRAKTPSGCPAPTTPASPRRRSWKNA
ncbi:MAG: class I tRNA ligase family protein [Tepidisphaeraceae bacterium]